ncbi:hypothetical protein ACFLZC_00400 [Patescibacteria group bacterium]
MAGKRGSTGWNLTKKGAGFMAGFAAGKLIGHNGGHEVASWLTGSRLDWSAPASGDWRPQWHLNENDRQKRQLVLFGGFAEQILSTEIILGWGKIPKDNPFVLGWLAWNFVEPIVYTVLHETRDGGYCDLALLEEVGVNAHLVEAGLLAHVAISAFRLYKNPGFPVFVKVTSKEIGIFFGKRF